ncbi:hypothetical protein C8R45DRAFT_1076418 [Mycena sanguinolenta]|nr:hypothetical protein C8R45DRAFT_1076418 [Mycena sanguinolenta]
MSTYEYRMQGSSARHSVNAVGTSYRPEWSSRTTHSRYDPRSSFEKASMTLDPSEELSNNGASFDDFVPINSLDYTPDLPEASRPDGYLTRTSVGAQYDHPHSSINASDYASPWPVAELSLHAHNMGNENIKFFGQPQNQMLASSNNRHGRYPPSSGALESAYYDSHHTPSPGDSKYPAQSRLGAQSQLWVSQLPMNTQPRLDVPTGTEMQNFVSMNDTITQTDLPENSPFTTITTNQNEETFIGYPYPKGHRWPQTFRITEIKQIGPKKQTLACFFCRSRKIACTTRPLDGTENGPCEQCDKRGFDCKYPTESKRGQHIRLRSSASQRE